MFDQHERELLIKLARNAIETYLDTGDRIAPPGEDFLKKPLAAFVTLKIHNELRGCIGSIDPSEPLGEMIIQAAISAAVRDPRFPPLSKAEYALIDLEISVLSLFQRILSPDQITPGVHGLMITRGHNRGLLLPQVATEYGWDSETFLAYTCQKAGLPMDAWKDPETVIEAFTAIVFGEELTQ